jgi:hypothetical protein
MTNAAPLFISDPFRQTNPYTPSLAVVFKVVTEKDTSGRRPTPDRIEYAYLNGHRIQRLNKILSMEQPLVFRLNAPSTGANIGRVQPLQYELSERLKGIYV